MADGKDSTKVNTEKCNPQMFSTAEDHIRTIGNSEVNFGLFFTDSLTDISDIAFWFCKWNSK